MVHHGIDHMETFTSVGNNVHDEIDFFFTLTPTTLVWISLMRHTNFQLSQLMCSILNLMGDSEQN